MRLNNVTKKLAKLKNSAAIFAKVFSEYLGRRNKSYDDFDLGGNVSLFYWKMTGDTENLGDYLSRVVVSHFREKLCPEGACRKKTTLYAIGSILGFRCQDAVIWGSGLLNPGKLYLQRLSFSSLDIRSVRGPKTREELLKIGKKCPEIYGDPAILMPEIYMPQDTRKHYDVSLVLHYVDHPSLGTADSIHRINILTSDYKNFIDQIVRSSKVISSSLHGIILAEAYGVPAVLLQQKGKDKFKYLDWYYSTGRTDVVIAHSLEEALQVQPMPLPDLSKMRKQVQGAFPVDLWS